MTLQLVGKCDERGSEQYNKGLGDRRWTGTEKIVGLHLERSRFIGIGFGESCHSARGNRSFEEWWQKNRVTEFVWTLSNRH